MTANSLNSHLPAGNNNFDILRLFAAVAVVFGHSFALSQGNSGHAEPLLRVLKFTYSGAVGVCIFFFISGLFVSRSYASDPSPIRFAIKRFLRIWPGLVVCLAVTPFIAASASGISPLALLRNPDLYNYVLNNSRLHLIWSINGVFPGNKYGINGSLWTLPLEVKMYCGVVVFGIFGLLSRTLLLFYVATMAGLSLLLFPAFYEAILIFSHEHLAPVLFFLAGMAAFAIRRAIIIRPQHILCGFIFLFLTNGIALQISFYVLLAILVIWFGCSPVITKLPKLPGDYSYGVYIYSFPLQQAAGHLWPTLGPYELFLTTLALVAPFAIASWHLIERPAQQTGHTLLKIESSDFFKGPALIALKGRGLAIPLATLMLFGSGALVVDQRVKNMASEDLGVKIVAFGPTPVRHREPFNVQPNGESAIWVKVDTPVKSTSTLFLAGNPLKTAVSGDLLTAFVPSALLTSAGASALWVELFENDRRFRSPSVTFVVE